jgi:hypothetical protein
MVPICVEVQKFGPAARRREGSIRPLFVDPCYRWGCWKIVRVERHVQGPGWRGKGKNPRLETENPIINVESCESTSAHKDEFSTT